MIKKIDNLGRVVVPKGFRTMLGLQPGDSLEVEVDDGKLTLSPHKGSCTFCGQAEALQAYLGKSVCEGCLSDLRQL